MAYTFRYRLNVQPSKTDDGSSVVMHDISAIVSIDGGVYTEVPGRHKVIPVPASVLSAALATGTNQEKTNAYRAALAAHLNDIPVPIEGWNTATLTLLMDANAASAAAALAAHTFITVTLNLNYPVQFAM